MRKLLFSLVFLFAFTLFVPTQKAYAHVLKTDGSIGAVIHINPEDDPIAGQESGFFFEFKDTKKAFSPEKCNCTFTVKQNGQVLNTQSLFQDSANPSLENVSVYYTFPQKGIYTVSVSGTPITPGEFESFTLTWDIRVEREESSPSISESGNDQNIKYIVLIAAVVIIVGLVLSRKKKPAKSK